MKYIGEGLKGLENLELLYLIFPSNNLGYNPVNLKYIGDGMKGLNNLKSL